MKKILVIPSWYPTADMPVSGIFIRVQAKCLARRFEVTVLTPRFPSRADKLRLRWGPRLIRENDEGIKIWRYRKLSIPTIRRWIPFLQAPDHVLILRAYRQFTAAVRRGFRRFVGEQGLPDIIHAHVVLPAGWIAVELGKEFGVPVVLTEHTEPFQVHLATARQRTLVKDILTRADRLIAVSPTLRDTMLAFCPEAKIEVLGNLIDAEFFTPGPPSPSERSFRFFCLALLTERKGLKYLLQAVQMLRSKGFENFEVHIGGDGPERHLLEQLAEDLGVCNRCRFLGMLDRARVREEMRACDVFVLPSLGETFGIVLGEAMACGKPVLSTRCGGPQDVVTPETGVLVDPANAQELAEAMAGFLNGRYSFQPYSIRDSVVRRFGENTFLDNIEMVYTDLIGQRMEARKKAG